MKHDPGDQSTVPANERAGLEREVSATVLAFLQEQAAAASLAGIAECWLKLRPLRIERATIKRVVEDLVARGLLQADGTGAARRYSLKTARNS